MYFGFSHIAFLQITSKLDKLFITLCTCKAISLAVQGFIESLQHPIAKHLLFLVDNYVAVNKINFLHRYIIR